MTDNKPVLLKDILANPAHPAHGEMKALTEKVESGEVSLCACLGPVYGEPYCPCEMRRRGMPPSSQHTRATKCDAENLQAILRSRQAQVGSKL